MWFSRVRHGFLAVAFFFGASALYTYPFFLDLRKALFLGQGDYLGEVALIAWNAQRLLDDPLRLFDRQFVFHSQFYYPHSNTHAYFQTVFFPGLLAVPGLALTSDPLLVTNALLVLALVLSGVLTYGLAFSLTGRILPSLLAGVVFSYLPYRMDHLGQFTVQQGFLLPVMLWAFSRFLLDRTWRHLTLLVLSLWAQALSTLYYAYAGGLFLLAFLAAFVLLRPRRVTWRLVVMGGVGLLVLGALLAPFLTPYLDVHKEMGFARDIGLAQIASMDLVSIFVPGVFNRIYRGHLPSVMGVEGGLFPGFVGLGLAVLAVLFLPRAASGHLLPRWVVPARRVLLAIAAVTGFVIVAAPWLGGLSLRIGGVRLLSVHSLTLPVILLPLLALTWVALEGRRRHDGPLTAREWIVTLLFLSIFTYLLTTGPTLTVHGRPWGSGFYRWLYLYVPGGNAFGAPGRWALVFVLCLALLAAFGARALAQRVPRGLGGVLGGLCLVALMVEYWTVPLPWQRLPEPPPVYRWLARQPGDFAILEIPVQHGPDHAWYMFWATFHRKRIVDGQLSFVPTTLQTVADVTDPLDLEAFTRTLRSIYPLRYLVVHRGLMRGDEGRLGQGRAWARARTTEIPGLELLESFGDDDVYAPKATPETGVDLQRYFSADFVRQHPVAEYDVRFQGTDPEVSRWVEITLNGRVVHRVETEGPGSVRLPPPYRAGDRNELRLVHRYAIAPAVAREEAYRIGQTSVYTKADIHAVSGGKFSGNTVSIRVNGVERVFLPRRGYHIVTLDPRDGRVLAVGQFDTFRTQAESHRMARMIEDLPTGTIVIAAVQHDGGGQLTEDAVRALWSLGARADTRGTLWLPHLVVGVKGASPGQAWEAVGPPETSPPLVASLGRERPLAFVLESFALR